MGYRYNSTIKIKIEPCTRCGHKKPVFNRNKKEGTILCKECATIESVQQDIEEEGNKIIEVAGLKELTSRLDEVFSKYIRLSHADEFKRVKCFTCPNVEYWTAMDAGHYIKRGNLLLRWDERNVKPQCQICNRDSRTDGQKVIFTRELERLAPGITEILQEESTIVYKPTRSELNGMLVDYTIKFKTLRHAS